jgi:hypothetical protein
LRALLLQAEAEGGVGTVEVGVFKLTHQSGKFQCDQNSNRHDDENAFHELYALMLSIEFLKHYGFFSPSQAIESELDFIYHVNLPIYGAKNFSHRAGVRRRMSRRLKSAAFLPNNPLTYIKIYCFPGTIRTVRNDFLAQIPPTAFNYYDLL